MKLGEFEPFQLEEDNGDTPKKQCASLYTQTRDLLSALPCKSGNEKEDTVSPKNTRYSLTHYTDNMIEDSEDEGINFAPLANPEIKVWVMDSGNKSSARHTLADLDKTDGPSRRGTTIFEILKVKKKGRPRLGTD